VMLHGYGHVKSLCNDLQAFMSKHGFTSIEDFQGYISYSHLVVIT
jgi:dihydropyrimidine dehydrogenase (NADP+)